MSIPFHPNRASLRVERVEHRYSSIQKEPVELWGYVSYHHRLCSRKSEHQRVKCRPSDKGDALAELSLLRCAGGRGGWGKSLQVEIEGGKGVCRVGGFECPRKIGAWRRAFKCSCTGACGDGGEAHRVILYDTLESTYL